MVERPIADVVESLISQGYSVEEAAEPGRYVVNALEMSAADMRSLLADGHFEFPTFRDVFRKRRGE
ncbi:hypothetical protein [Hyphomicrobium sp. ghe19]|uniref:hypothetical protein n=1 Tax=Hyphomicrobium sp. ghe19 TaxID=2682968 RepID=UPI001366A616|nr:hypothetical protein HYPP_03792 [Hyphomicrobium sp. ghe19]